MTQTYWQLKEKIAALQAEADVLKSAERDDVIAKSRAAIAAYGITVKDLFGARVAKPARKGAAAAATAKYLDGKGNVWGGRGPRPQWIRNALQSGAKLEDFLAGKTTAKEAKNTGADAAAAAAVAATESKAKGKGKRKGAAKKAGAAKKVAAKYRDEAGNTWSGRGLQPRWLKAAIATGKKLEDFAI